MKKVIKIFKEILRGFEIAEELKGYHTIGKI